MALPIKDNVPGWLEGIGDHADVAMSSRIRLARNLKGYPFSSKIRLEDEKQIREEVLKVLEREKVLPSMTQIDLKGLTLYECNYLLEEHLISSDLLSRRKAATVVVDQSGQISMMINEEDH